LPDNELTEWSKRWTEECIVAESVSKFKVVSGVNPLTAVEEDTIASVKTDKYAVVSFIVWSRWLGNVFFYSMFFRDERQRGYSQTVKNEVRAGVFRASLRGSHQMDRQSELKQRGLFNGLLISF